MSVPRESSLAAWRKEIEKQVKRLRLQLQAATFLTSTEPTEAVRNSTWINPADGNAPHYFNGTSWVPIRDETIATAQGTADQAATDAAAADAAAAQAALDAAAAADAAALAEVVAAAAQAAAEAAQTSADGKNVIYRQATEPSVGASGDTWFDSDDDNKIYVHDGADWVPSELGTSAILDLAISNAKIADLAVDNAKIGNLDVGKLTTGNLTANMTLSSIISTRTGGVGSGVDLGPFGLATYAPNGMPRTVLPTDPALPDQFKGMIEAQAATFTGGVSFAPGSVSTVERGGVFTLASGVTDPQQAPSVVIDWESLALPDAQHGMGLVWKDSKWWTAEWGGIGAACLVSYHSTTGAEVDRILLTGGDGYIPGGGLAWNGTNWYVLGQSQIDFNWYLLRYDTSGILQNGSQYTPIDGTADGWYYAQYHISKMGIGYRASTGAIVIAEFDTTSTPQFRIQHRDPTTCAVTSTNFTASVSGFTGPVGGLAFGSFDYGSERMALTSRNNGNVWIFNPATSYSYQGTESFPAASGMTTGLAWDGSNFFVSKIFPGVSTIYKHTAMTWTATADGNWWVPYTWYDSNATGGNHESAAGPAANFTMKKRARYTVTTPAIPVGGADDPNAVRVFVGRGATLPARTSMWLQSIPFGAGYGPQAQTFTTLTTAGTNPPAATNYPVSATPALFKNSAGTLVASGDGSILATRVTQTLPQPYAYARFNAGAPLASSVGTYLTVTNWTVLSSSGITYSAGVFTVSIAGRYRISATLSYQTNGTGVRGCRLVEGGTQRLAKLVPAIAGGVLATPVSADDTYVLAAGGTLAVAAFQNSTASLNVLGASDGTYTVVSIDYVGPI